MKLSPFDSLEGTMKSVQLTCALLVLVAAAMPARAADIPVNAPVVKASAAATVFDWSGFYAGAHVGYAWGHAKIGRLNDNNDHDGWLAGGQLGYNVQTGSWVWGAALDGSWTNIKNDNADPTCNETSGFLRISNLFTARLRTGPAIGSTFYYVTGGFATAGMKFRDFDDPIHPIVSKRHNGYTVGLGAEHAFAPNWSARLEYLYVKLGEKDYDLNGAIDSVDPTAHLVRAAVNYRFATGQAPLVTRY
jgi:outer membrane immunogenic protein